MLEIIKQARYMSPVYRPRLFYKCLESLVSYTIGDVSTSILYSTSEMKCLFHYMTLSIYLSVCLSVCLKVNSLHHNVLPTLQSTPLMTNGPLYPAVAGFLLPWPAYNASKPMIISHDKFRIIVLAWTCVCVAMAGSVRSGSVAVVRSIFCSDHWWL